MKKILWYIFYYLLVVALGLAIPAIIVLITNSFTFDVVKFSNYAFIISFFASLTGGIMVVAKFAIFSRRVKKARPNDAVYVNKDSENLFLKLDYILLISGLTLVFISYYLVA